MKFIDLFAGIGGFHLACETHECVFASDIDKKCQDVYQKNFKMICTGNIKTIAASSIPDFDLLCAGFPCQSFSHSGKQKGFDDKVRGNLFFYICDIIKEKSPKYLCLENVKNLVRHDNGKTWKTIYNMLTDLGYNTYKEPIVLSPRQFGIPQNRERVFIIALRKDIGALQPFPTLPKQITSIESILQPDDDIPHEIIHQIKLSEQDISLLTLWEQFVQHFKSIGQSLPTFPLWTSEWGQDYDISDLPIWKQQIIRKNRNFYNSNRFLADWYQQARSNQYFKGAKAKFEWQAGSLRKSDSIWTLLFQYRPSGIRIKRCDYSPALVAMNQVVYVGSRRRKLTPREVARLQSFPDDFVVHNNLNTAYKQFGNSVNVDVCKFVIHHLTSHQ